MNWNQLFKTLIDQTSYAAYLRFEKILQFYWTEYEGTSKWRMWSRADDEIINFYVFVNSWVLLELELDERMKEWAVLSKILFIYVFFHIYIKA